MTNRNNAIWCLIPVYNHAVTLRKVAKETLEHCPNLIVVDDGSTDAEIAEVLDGLNLVLLKHDRNLGKEAALKTGAREAKRRGAAFVITLDADGQHDPADIEKFLPLLDNKAPRIVVGARVFSDSVPDRSKFGRGFSNFWVRFETGVDVRDTQSGFRAYPVEVLLEKSIASTHYAFETEVLVRAAWSGIEIVNVDVSVFYPDKDERISHFKVFKDNLRISLLHAKLTGERLFRGPRGGAGNPLPASGGTVKTIPHSAPSATAEIAEILNSPGAVALIPTETVYGLACGWNDAAARQRMAAMKSREKDKPFQMLVDSLEMAIANGAAPSKKAEALIRSLTPGPLTFVVEASCENRGFGDSIGLRIPDHQLTLDVISQLGHPLAATSANTAGAPPATTVSEALDSLDFPPDLAIDAGEIKGSASTVVDLRGDTPSVVREGTVPAAEIAKQWSASN